MNTIFKTSLISALIFSVALTGCGGGGDSGGSGGGGNPTSDGLGLSDLYVVDNNPDIANCDEGRLRASATASLRIAVNEIRQLHNLPPVSYDFASDEETAKSALISVANDYLSHEPTMDDWHCYTTDGEEGSRTSNLGLIYSSDINNLPDNTRFLALFLIDENVEKLGHRRLLLDPFLSSISYGRVDGVPIVPSSWVVSAASLKVINDGDSMRDITAETNGVDYIAYPYESYPAEYFQHGWSMSFSVLHNKTDRDMNAASVVDFSGAMISVTDPDGNALTVTEQSYDYETLGLPNSLEWKVNGTTNGVQYDVVISNILVNDVPTQYDYWFEIN